MLTQLHIENIAVIKKASIPLGKGLNVFTGETGAGKTILISAIDAVLGERTSRDIIRTGEDKAVVSALFEDISPETQTTLEELGYETEDGTILVFREIHASGRNVCRINGMPANVSILKSISSQLIHIHGQRDSQELLAPENHLGMIDNYAILAESVEEYSTAFANYRALQNELKALSLDENQKAQRMDMLRFQITEIEQAQLNNSAEEDELQAQRKVIQGSERIRRGFATAHNAWNGGEQGAGMQVELSSFVAGIAEIAQFVPAFETVESRMQEIKYELEEYAVEVAHALDDYDFDPSELDQIEYRLDALYKLKQKYGNSIPAILEHYDTISKEYDAVSSNEERQSKLQKQIKKQEETCQTLAQNISAKRQAATKEFIAKIEEELTFLDMPSVSLSAQWETTALSSTGIDVMEFFIVTNVGETPKPLSRIASGGEISRIMLAIKNVLAYRDNIDSLIFDEVDTGVSGKAAGKIGQKLKEVSQTRQVISVTHLAQVAAFADNHMLITKESDKEHTYTQVLTLNYEETVEELARITSGEVITPAALESAEELWQRAHN